MTYSIECSTFTLRSSMISIFGIVYLCQNEAFTVMSAIPEVETNKVQQC